MGGKGLRDLSLFMEGRGGGDFEGDFRGNGAEEDQSSRTGGGGEMKNSIEFIKLPILATYSNFEGCVEIKNLPFLALREFVASFPNLMTRTS